MLTERQSKPNATHEAIVRLARSAADRPRIVTTNYDTLLSQGLPPDTRTYEYPDLPGRGDFAGVVHLHGSLSAQGALVATDSELADAYMGTRAVGTLFLERLFDKNAVLFIGYSLNDVLVRYLLKAQTRTSELYILHTRPAELRWRELHVCPIGYESHSQLPAVLSEWAAYTESGISGQDQRVGVIVAAGPPESSHPDDSYIRGVLHDPHRVGLFTGRAQDARWLTWIASTFHPGLICKRHEELTEAQRELQSWLARCFATDDQTAKAAHDLICGSGAAMPMPVWRQMLWMLRSPRRCGVSPDLKRRLIGAMADVAPDSAADLLLELIDDCQPHDDDSLVLELFARIHSPRLRNTGRDPFPARGLQPPGDSLLSRFRHLAGDLMVIADQRLRQDAQRNDLADTPQQRLRQAIEPHPQNDELSHPDSLVDAARDLLDILIEDQPDTAAAQIRAWERSRWTILRRLALYGHTVRGDITADAKLAMFTSHPTLIEDRDLHHETMRLIASALPHASPAAVDDLVAAVRDHEASDRIRFNKLGWIAHWAGTSQTAQAAFDAEQDAHPNWEMSDHPDFLIWVEMTVTDGFPDEYRADLPDLAALMANDPDAALEQILANYTKPDPDTPHNQRWLDALGSVHAATEADPQACLCVLNALISYEHPHIEAVSSVARAALMSLDAAARQDATLIEGTDIRSLFEGLWRAATDRWPQPDARSDTRDWTQTAANSCAGIITRLVMLAIKPQQPHPDSADGVSLAPEAASLLNLILQGDAAASHHAQVVCAQHLSWLHAVDRRWANQHILALLDPTIDPDRALRCWEGYLYHARWNHEMIEDGLLEHLTAFAPLIEQCGRTPQGGFARLTTGISLYSTAQPLDPEFPWLNRLTATSTEPTRVAFIRALGHELANLPPQQREQQWDRWVSRYLTNRAQGEPRQLSPREASATAAVGAQLGDLFPAVGRHRRPDTSTLSLPNK